LPPPSALFEPRAGDDGVDGDDGEFGMAMLIALAPVSSIGLTDTILHQTPTLIEGIGILLVMSGVALHKEM
jgi:hypothetical protein